MEIIEHLGWKNCVHLINRQIEVFATTDVGPRIIQVGYINEKNLFKTIPEQLGMTNKENWMLFGGHRLWHTPEEKPRTYYPDSHTINFKEIENGVELEQRIETTTGIQKKITITLDPDLPYAIIFHTLTNRGMWPVVTSAWSLSVMAPGGVALIPLPPRGPHPQFLLPTSQLTLWPYTTLNDPRWSFGAENIFLKQDSNSKTAQKVGVHTPEAWLGYLNEGYLFVKLASFDQNANYADMDSNIEVFTDHRFLELETLSGIKSIEPGESITHTEYWLIKKDVPPLTTDEDVDAIVKPQVEDLLKYSKQDRYQNTNN